jgi:hypothetical protein
VLVLGLQPSCAVLRSVVLRGAGGDRLRERQRLERALADVEWRPPEVPPEALLLVRRLLPEQSSEPKALSQRVSLALRRHAGRARRPWVHADASSAEAVLFADEAELVACLARDLVSGALGGRWWWRYVLGGLDAREWLRGRALTRGEVIAPALLLLAERGLAAAWVERIHDADARTAIESIAFAYGLSTVESPSEGAELQSTAGPRRTGRIRRHETEQARAAAFVQLLEVVPELRAASSLGVQRRLLLSLALGVTRAPAWVRTAEFRKALRAVELESVSLALESAARDADEKPRPAADRDPEDVAAGTGRVDQESVAAIPVHEAAAAPHVHAPRAGQPVARARATPPPVDEAQAPETRSAVPLGDAGAVRSSSPTLELSNNGVTLSPVAPDASPNVESARREESIHTVSTRFGGIFYLLNAALALGYYGDFTAPLARGLALPPWDFLALAGRAWFGRAFARDPVWRVLAQLAGRAAEEEPGRERVGPRNRRSRARTRRVTARWLRPILRTLRARLALAVGVKDGRSVPALVCRHDAQVAVTLTRVDVALPLAGLPLAIRIAGLDRDPGWIPAAGRGVAFRFA